MSRIKANNSNQVCTGQGRATGARRGRVSAAQALLAAAMCLTLTGCAADSGSGDPGAAVPTLAPDVSGVTRPTYTVQRGDVVVSTSFTGRVIPIIQQSLFFRTAGKVGKLYAQQGDSVQAGQILAELDGIEGLKRDKATNDLDIQASQTQAEIAQLSLDLYKAKTAPNEPGYSQQVAILERQLTLVQLTVTKAQLNSSALEEAINNSMVAAPFAGQLRTLDVREGDAVEAYDRIAVVADVGQLAIGADLAKEVLSQLSESMPVVVTSSKSPGKALAGTILQLPYPYGKNTLVPSQQGDDTIAWISLKSLLADAGLKLDDPVTVTAVLQHKEKTLWLPPEAVGTFEGKSFVIVRDGDLQRRVEVTTGLRMADRLEILSGLNEGQVVEGQ